MAAPPPTAPEEVAAAAGLVYVDDTMPGLRRIRRGSQFSYRDAAGKPVRDAKELARIRKLAIPPAYTDVWICPIESGHLQATGRDARGRKQYRYHAQWNEWRGAGKFDRLAAFGAALPRIRARVARDLAAHARVPVPTRQLVLATLVRLLDTTFLRIGNTAYARDNGSYGLTTLRNRHADVRGSTVQLKFRGKSGVEHHVKLDDPRVARVVRRCQHLPGQELFGYVDDDGQLRSVGSSDVNDYLQEALGQQASPDAAMRFTAKDFRTWHGTVQAMALAQTVSGDPAARMTEKQVLTEVARRLGNTVAVCRKAYVHPAVLALCAGDAQCVQATADAVSSGAPQRGLSAPERALLQLLAATAAPRKRAARVRKFNAPKARPANSRMAASPQPAAA